MYFVVCDRGDADAAVENLKKNKSIWGPVVEVVHCSTYFARFCLFVFLESLKSTSRI